MAKKYVPSGYQIIDLGTVAENDEIPTTEGSDASLLSDLCDDWINGAIIKKPLLIRLFDETSELRFVGVPVIQVNQPDGELKIVLHTELDGVNSKIKEYYIFYDGALKLSYSEVAL